LRGGGRQNDQPTHPDHQWRLVAIERIGLPEATLRVKGLDRADAFPAP
jgi:hypothetical protein